MDKHLIFVVILACSSAQAETLRLVADPWCPFNCEPESERPGFMIEIAQKVFADAGIEVEYSLLPWLRALKATEDGDYHAAVGASRVEAPNFIFPSLPQGRMRNGFWVHSASDWEYDSVSSLNKVNLATVAGYGYGPNIELFLQDPANSSRITELSGETPLNSGILMLERGRIDVFLEEYSVFRYELKQRERLSDFKMAGEVPLDFDYSDVYIAFSPAHQQSESYAAILSEGMAALRRSGELAQILDRYGVQDWDP